MSSISMGGAIAPIAPPSRSPSKRVNAGGGTAGKRSDTGIRLALLGFGMNGLRPVQQTIAGLTPMPARRPWD
ncbi:hypothetical protein XFF7766_280073 [Xanthomonas citri pv. fuscans]|nr:hypothetical protein XFF7766_280073 [Xanthomonas citri pv. fuscans]